VATNYPGTLDGTANVGGGVEPEAVTALDDSTSGHPTHSGLHQNLGDAVQQLETKVGIGASTPSANQVLACASGSTSTWSDSPSVANLTLSADLTAVGATLSGDLSAVNATLSGNLNSREVDDLALMVNNGDVGYDGRKITVSATEPTSPTPDTGDLWIEIA
jgi:hypothetical protein